MIFKPQKIYLVFLQQFLFLLIATNVFSAEFHFPNNGNFIGPIGKIYRMPHFLQRGLTVIYQCSGSIRQGNQKNAVTSYMVYLVEYVDNSKVVGREYNI